ncbi:MAG TPA: hypothetical protein VFI31_12515, partial [Pirellulales bacterium]|nr:hypothetical protein [Pirellulales bacterium]
KKAPVGILETVYPANVGPGVGTGTMLSSGLVDSRHLATITLPEAINPQDTKPDVYQTIVGQQPVARPKPWWRLSVKLVVSLGVVLLAALGAAFTGKQTDADVNRFIAASEYKNAIGAIDAPFWRRWRSDPRELRERVVTSATEDAKKLAEKAEVHKALLIQNQIKGDLTRNEEKEFRDSVFQVAVHLANEKADARDYRGAYDIFTLLSDIDETHNQVVELGRNIWQRWSEHVLQHAQAKNFEAAARVFEDLASIENPNVYKVKAEVIAAGIKAITDAQNESRFRDALDIANRLKAVEAFAGDTGLKNAIFEVLPHAIAAAQDALKNGNVDEARGLYKLLAALQPYDTQVIGLNKSILDHELQKARGRLEERKWEAALTEYDRVLGELSKDERDASTAELDELKGKIVTAAKEEFDEKMKTDADEDLDRAGEICDRLRASLPDNLTLEIMVDEHKRRSSKTSNTPTLTPEMIVERLLGRTDENIRDRVLDEAEKELAEADAKIAADLPMRADLLRRAAIAHAYLAWQQKDWAKAQSWLEKTKDSDLLDKAEAAQRTRRHLLGVLVQSRFDGNSLPADIDLDAVSQTVADLRKADPEWADSADRLLATRVKELSRELGRQAANLTASADPAKRSLGTSILKRIDRVYLPDPASVEILIAANQTLDLLNDTASAWPQIEKSLEGWSAGRDRLPGDLQGRLVAAFARWGSASKEPEALKQAIDEVEHLPRANDELRRQFAEMLVEEMRREASQPRISWQDLEETCRRAESAATAAAAADLGTFIKACQAECALEKALAAGKQPLEAAFRSVEGLQSAAVPETDRPYVDYVVLHVANVMHRKLAENDAAPLADRLCEALESPPEVLSLDFRRQASAVALVEVAKKLAENVGEAATPWTPPPLEPDSAGRVHRWIEQSLKIDPKLADFSTNLALATAAASTAPVDEATLDGLMRSLSADPQCQSAWILLRGTQSAAKTKPAEAVRLYARSLAAAEGATLVGDAAQAAFDNVIKPGLDLAQKHVPESSGDVEAKKAVAALYAAKGRLLRTQYGLLEDDQKPDQEAFAALDLAVRYDPDQPEYYVRRGFVRWYLSGGSDLATLEKEDLGPLFDGRRGAPPPGAYGLRGQAKILGARQASGSERLALYRNSIADFEEAIRGSQQQPSEHFSEFLDGLATANVEMANYTDEGRDAQRACLERAVELAEQSKAIEYRPHPEYAWINLGNAEEDFPWVLRDDPNHYCTAIDAFERAAAEANTALSSPGLALLAQGRARYKLLAAGGSCGRPWKDEFKAALQNLNDAVNLRDVGSAEVLPASARAEGCFWQTQLHLWMAAKEPAAKKEHYQKADAALERAIEILGKQGKPLYYLSSMTLAANMQDFDKAVSRAKRFVDADLPAASLDDKVTAIVNLADLYSRRNDVNSALKTFGQYVDDARFQAPTTARFDLLYERASLIAAVGGRFLSDNKKLCLDSAAQALDVAQQLNDKRREAKAWHVRALAAKLSYTSATPSVAERKTYAEYLRNAIQCLPGKDDLKDTWGWRVDLANADYLIATASEKASATTDSAAKASALADVAFFSDEAIKTLQGVDAFAKDKPQLVTSLGQLRKVTTQLFQKYKQYLPANRAKSAQR